LLGRNFSIVFLLPSVLNQTLLLRYLSLFFLLMGLLMICFWSLLLLSQISCFWEVLGLFCFDLCVYKMLSSVSIYGYNGSWIFFLYNSRVRTSVLSSWIFRPLALVLFGPLTLRMSSTIGGCSLFTNELNCLPST